MINGVLRRPGSLDMNFDNAFRGEVTTDIALERNRRSLDVYQPRNPQRRSIEIMGVISGVDKGETSTRVQKGNGSALNRLRHSQDSAVGIDGVKTVRRKGILEKRALTNDVVWIPREVVLSDSLISFSTVDGARLLDWIPLVEIVSVSSLKLRRDSSVSMNTGHLSFSAVFNRMPNAPSDSWTELPASTSAERPANLTFEIETKPDGCNSGRRYQMRCSSREELSDWVEQIRLAWQAVLAEQNAALQSSPLQRAYQRLCLVLTGVYESEIFKSSLIFVLAANFVALLVAAQIEPTPGTTTGTVMDQLEYVFTSIFTAELLLNIFVNWFWPFIRNLWVLGFDNSNFEVKSSLRSAFCLLCLSFEPAPRCCWS